MKEELILRVIDKNIGIVMCPSSNRQIIRQGKTNDAEYPLKRYMAHGLKVLHDYEKEIFDWCNQSVIN